MKCHPGHGESDYCANRWFSSIMNWKILSHEKISKINKALQKTWSLSKSVNTYSHNFTANLKLPISTYAHKFSMMHLNICDGAICQFFPNCPSFGRIDKQNLTHAMVQCKIRKLFRSCDWLMKSIILHLKKQASIFTVWKWKCWLNGWAIRELFPAERPPIEFSVIM